jgi:phage N-6-adenine-methyltransferase
MAPPIEGQCPQCEAVAVGRAAVETTFGFRKLRGRTIPQSWCRACRSRGGLGDLELIDARPAAGDRWATPRSLFEQLHAVHGYTVDLAAEAHNALLPRYFPDGLHTPWTGERGWCNPPYSKIAPWIAKADEAALATFLVPVRTDQKWFSVIWDRSSHRPHDGWTVDFPEGRVRFEGAATDPNWPSMVCTWKAQP